MPPPNQVNRGNAVLVLLVEDDPAQQDLYSAYLMFQGFRVATAVNSGAALALARVLQPHAIVIDATLPGAGTTASRLRSEPRTGHIPLVALAERGPAAPSQPGREGHYDACITKPCSSEDLFVTIQRVLERRQA